jgi:hypothetical protein
MKTMESDEMSEVDHSGFAVWIQKVLGLAFFLMALYQASL